VVSAMPAKGMATTRWRLRRRSADIGLPGDSWTGEAAVLLAAEAGSGSVTPASDPACGRPVLRMPR
jgi:hypothetical protein